jgi:two-component system response regulator AtoC
VRELENIIERAMILAEKDVIDIDVLPMHMQGAKGVTPISLGLSIKKNAREMEINLIKDALKKTGGNRLRAARMLEISHKALLYKIKDYGLEDYGKEVQ